jgi:hypothetical protein
MKALGAFLLMTMLQSCNQPFSIPKHDSSLEPQPNGQKVQLAGAGNYQRFLPVNGNPMLALDTVTGQLCRTYPTVGTIKPEDVKLLNAPFCRDLWAASNIPVSDVTNTSSTDQSPQK